MGPVVHNVSAPRKRHRYGSWQACRMPPAASSPDHPLLAAFLDHERAVRGLAAETLRHRALYLRTFLAWWDHEYGPAHPRQATTAQLFAFLVAEADRGIAPATRKAQVVALRRFYAWLVASGQLAADPTGELEGPRVPPREIAVYRPEEIRAIPAYTGGLTDQRGRLRHVIVATLRFTGMRSGELRSLRLDGLDLAVGEARVIGKGQQPRVVVLPPPLQPILAAYLAEVRPALPDSPLLLSNPVTRVTTPLHGFSHEAVYREVSLAGTRAGVPGRHFPHRWRHTFATELVRAGVDIHVVQRLLGHRSVTATVGYTHLAVSDLRQTLERHF
jgi:site-specific recombinase XerD